VDFTTDKLREDNSIAQPENIVPSEAAFTGEGSSIHGSIAPLCFSIFVFEK